MFRKSMIVLALVTTTAGAAFAQPTPHINVWGAHFDVPIRVRRPFRRQCRLGRGDWRNRSY